MSSRAPRKKEKVGMVAFSNRSKHVLGPRNSWWVPSRHDAHPASIWEMPLAEEKVSCHQIQGWMVCAMDNNATLSCLQRRALAHACHLPWHGGRVLKQKHTTLNNQSDQWVTCKLANDNQQECTVLIVMTSCKAKNRSNASCFKETIVSFVSEQTDLHSLETAPDWIHSVEFHLALHWDWWWDQDANCEKKFFPQLKHLEN